MGIHNEAGLHEIDPMPSVDSLISDMLKYCLDAEDKDRAFVDFKSDDTVLLLINNFGGMSKP
jgi:dihydroxyacetone kinase